MLFRSRPARSDESGFALIEIVVSMFMLALLAVAFLPLLIQGVRQSAANATIATATQIVQQKIESVRSATTCAALSSAPLLPTITSSSTLDSRGVTLAQTNVVGPCPITVTVLNSTVSVTSTVKRVDTGLVLATATTYVYVSGP